MARGIVVVTDQRDVLIAAPGPQGPAGPSGGGSGGGAELHHQVVPSASWVIPHTFGRFVGVRLIGDDGIEMYADVAQIVNQVSVTFPEPTTGYALLV